VCLPIPPRPRVKLYTKTPGINLAFSKYGVDDGDRTHDNRSHNPALYQLSYAHHIASCLSQDRQMAHPAGLEPATIRLEGGCSIQLSYGRLSTCLSRLKAFGFGKNFAASTFAVLPSDWLCSTSGANVIETVSARQQGKLKKSAI
jgi:hypothetical protein